MNIVGRRQNGCCFSYTATLLNFSLRIRTADGDSHGLAIFRDGAFHFATTFFTVFLLVSWAESFEGSPSFAEPGMIILSL